MTAAFGYLFNECQHGKCWTTSEERALLDRGDYSGYYSKACAGGDPYACAGGSEISAGESAMAQFTTLRLQLYSLVDTGRFLTNVQMESLRLDLAIGYAKYLGYNKSSGVWPTKIGIAEMHWEVFPRYGIKQPSAFGGTPFGRNGGIWFADRYPNFQPGWCPECQ